MTLSLCLDQFCFQGSDIAVARSLIHRDLVLQLFHLHFQKLQAGQLCLAVVSQIFGIILESFDSNFGHGFSFQSANRADRSTPLLALMISFFSSYTYDFFARVSRAVMFFKSAICASTNRNEASCACPCVDFHLEVIRVFHREVSHL